MDLRRMVLAGIFGVAAAWGASAAVVEYVGADGWREEQECTMVGSGSTSWSGWMAVEGEVEVDGRIEVGGAVNVILCDGAALSATNGGIRVAKGASLTVWGQREGSGRLVATGSSSCAGIGGNDGESGGTVVVYGGKVEAKGGEYGAGIGGGDSGAGGVVEVHGGEVWAGGNDGSAGIGGGDYGNGGSFTITGGKVTALGGARKAGGKATGQAAAGIGAGRPEIDRTAGTVVSGGHRSSGTVSILGGEVTAKAGVPPTSVQNMEYYHPDAAQAIGVNVQDAKSNGTNYLSLGAVAVYTSADAAEPVPAAERAAACRGSNVWTRPCKHGTGLTCPWCGETKGKGTAEEPYLIGNYAALVEFEQIVNGTHATIGQNLGAWGVLAADIVAEGTDWVAMVTNRYLRYTGTFDGAGHTISGLKTVGTASYAGLFGWVGDDGVVRNVRLEGVAFQGTYPAGIVWENFGTVSNCCVSGFVRAGSRTGGIVGCNAGMVANCHFCGEISGRGENIGGVVGENDGTVANCHNSGTMSARDGNIGGVVGENDDGTVANSYCLDSVGAAPIGENKGAVEGECEALSAAAYTNAASFKGWDFENVWEMGVEGPWLRVFGPAPVLPGDGTEGNPYRIGNYVGLVEFARRVNVELEPCAWGVLTADIVAERADWVPICNDPSDYFHYRGTFDGKGHTISGLANEGALEYAGLFAHVLEDGVVRNVRLEGVEFNGRDSGGVVGHNKGTVSNCCVSGIVRGDINVGGLVGFNLGTVANCFNTATVLSDRAEWIGGVAGWNQGWPGSILNCHSTGAVSGEKHRGGITAYNHYGTVANCYFPDSLKLEAIGGNNGAVEECEALTAAEYTNAASFHGWDFENVWWMGPEMPLLRVFGPLELTVESAYGTAEPSAGAHGYYRGVAVEAWVEGSPVSLGNGLQAVCTGWELEGNEPGSGEGTVARFTLTNSAVLRWTWETQVSTQAQVTVGGEQWQVVSVPFKNPASEDGTYMFWDTEVASELLQGSTVLFWDAEKQEWSGGMKSARGWAWGQGSHVLGCGEAFFVRNGGGGEATLTIGGAVPTEASRSRGYEGGGKWSLMAPMYPIPVKFGDTMLAIQLPQESKMRFWDAGRQEWVEGTKTAMGWEWAAGGHVLGVGEGFFIQSEVPGTWVQEKPGVMP